MMEVLAEVNSLESLKAVCCNGTATNSGWKQGLVPHLERELQRKLVSEASGLMEEEEERRHGRILSVLEARRCRKPFDTKKKIKPSKFEINI